MDRTPPFTASLHAWQVVRHWNLILVGSLSAGGVHILRIEPGVATAEQDAGSVRPGNDRSRAAQSNLTH